MSITPTERAEAHGSAGKVPQPDGRGDHRSDGDTHQFHTAVVTHPTLADRLAAMLNYFLKTWSREEKFKSFQPGEVKFHDWRNCCPKIYLHLEGSKTFIKSISSDGRSYSP